MSPSGHRARKRFGQNFLSDPGILRRLAATIGAGPEEHLVEIGPGRGALTALLLAVGCRLDVIELDRDLVPLLQDEFGADEHFHLHQGDALRFDFAALAGAQPLRVVGNLPYNISTPLLFHLLKQHHCIRDMHFMLQKEVVERLAAVPGTKAWGRLGVMTQYHCRVESLFEVPPEAFVPSPKVRSAVVKLVPYETPPHPASDIDRLQAVVRTAFNQRRKTLRNALKTVIDAQSLEALGIDPLIRPERLTLAQFVAIANQPDNRQARPEHT